MTDQEDRMSSSTPHTPDDLLELPAGAEIGVTQLHVQMRGASLEIRHAEDQANPELVYLKVELDADGEIPATPADLDALARQARTFLRLMREG